MELVCRHYWVEGLVQGVFFRASTQAQSSLLGLKGWVRNAEDGRVECMACGRADKICEFERWLRVGPSNARVDKLDIEVRPVENCTEFTVLP